VSPLPWAVLDLDGTVADVRHRLHHLDYRPKHWDAFFSAAADDPLLPEGAAVAHRLAEDHRVAYLSGRPERCRKDTLRWLKRYGLPDGPVYLRRDDDRRPSWMGKLSRLKRLAADGGVDVVVDDDAVVIKQARAAGFNVLVADWMPTEDSAAAQTLFDAQHDEGRT
jgi:predicted secreted acid phosphatase